MKLLVEGGLNEPANRIRLLIVGIIFGGIFYGAGMYINYIFFPNAVAKKYTANENYESYLQFKKPGVSFDDPDFIRPVNLSNQAKESMESAKFWKGLNLSEVGIGLLFILGMPFFWYFLLNRIKELSSAIKQ